MCPERFVAYVSGMFNEFLAPSEGLPDSAALHFPRYARRDKLLALRIIGNRKSAIENELLAPSEGLEPPTPSLGRRRSIL